MTQPTPPSHSQDRQFARDVARQLDRRRTRRRLTLWSTLLALVIAAAAYLRLGGGLGALGLGGGAGDSDGERRLAGPARCQIRVSAAGIVVGGKAMARDAAVAACKDAPGADVIITGDAREDDWRDLQAALQAAGVQIAVHHPVRPAGSANASPR